METVKKKDTAHENYFEQYNRSEVTKSRRIINTPNDVTRKNLFYVQEAGRLKSLKPHESHRKNLDSFLFLVVLSGEGRIGISELCDERQDSPRNSGQTGPGDFLPCPPAKDAYGNRRQTAMRTPAHKKNTMTEFTVLPHQCAFIDCHSEYSHISSADKPWELMWVHFNGPAAAYYHRLFSQRSGPVFNVSDFDKITETITKIIEAHETYNADADILSSMLITTLLVQAITENNSCQRPVQNAIKNPKSYQMDNDVDSAPLASKLSRVLSYIDDNFCGQITLDSLSSTFFISKYYLAHAFKEQYQITIIQYILVKRINYAKELLRYTDDSIESIARKCGMSDSSHFNKVFKKLEGMTASQYRRQW